MIIRMKADPRHAVNLMAPPQVLLPVRQLRVDGPEWNQTALPIIAAVPCEPFVRAGKVFVEDTVEASGPCLGHAAFPQPEDQAGRIVASQPPKRPARQADVRVDDHMAYPLLRKTGVSMRRRLPPRIRCLIASGISAPITLANCEAKLRPAASLPKTIRSGPSSRTATSTTPEVGLKPERSTATLRAARTALMPISQSPPVWAPIRVAAG